MINLFTFDGKLELQIAYDKITAKRETNKFEDNTRETLFLIKFATDAVQMIVIMVANMI